MPYDLRQRLKPFGPRIIGSRDAKDAARARVLLNAVALDLLPHIALEFTSAAGNGLCGRSVNGTERQPASPRDLWETVLRYLSCTPDVGSVRVFEEAAFALASLISHGARTAGTVARRDWYWLKAIELLDALCDVGGDSPQPLSDIDIGRLGSIETSLVDGMKSSSGGRERPLDSQTSAICDRPLMG